MNTLTNRLRAQVTEVPLASILPFRENYRREMDCQIVHDSWHDRGLTRSYSIELDGQVVGYGSVGGAPRDPKETIKEFYLLPEFRGHADRIFPELVRVSGARRIEAQTNDPLLFLMLLDSAVDLSSDRILFADGTSTDLSPPGATFRNIDPAERGQVFPHDSEPVGDHAVIYEGIVAATGGMLFHYNPPYADIFMEVAEPFRRLGLGSFLVQELRRVCYQHGNKPAARCDSTNLASRRTLQRAGMFPCGRIVQGKLVRP